jgi:4-amino-4-deoxy-L-arabinose transferase-like glycosyltransferase
MNTMNFNLHSWTDRQLTLSVAAIACLISFCLVALHLWDNRDLFDPDGISYLDMADAYVRGDWRAALNGVWSPLYSWLLALMIFFFDPSGYWEFTAVHALNLIIYLLALASFSVFMREFLRANEETAGNGRLPDWSWLVLGYSLFTWSTTQLIPLHLAEPDLIVAALLYLIFAMLFRIRAGTVTWGGSILLGMLLGLGYLTKAIMFPMSFVFIGVALALSGRSPKKLIRILVTFLVFLSLSLPYIIVLSNAKGHWTYSDAGRLNYAWDINKVKLWIHWQGEDQGHGFPVHPTRKIHDDPPLYEFGTPFKATYAPWYDPSYWYEGVEVKLNLQRQLSVFASNTNNLLRYLANSTEYATENKVAGGHLGPSEGRTIGPLLALFCVIVLANLGRVSILRGMTKHWFALVPIAAVLGLYAMLHIEGRFIGAYVVTLWMVLFKSVAIPQSEESKKVFTAILAIAALTVAFTLAPEARRAASHAARYLVNDKIEAPFLQSGYTNWKVVEYLHSKGLRAGDPVGSVGNAYRAYWARMARVRVVAEIPEDGAMEFWLSDKAKRAVVMKKFRDVGVKAVITSDIPVGSMRENWRQIGGTNNFVCVFQGEECK